MSKKMGSIFSSVCLTAAMVFSLTAAVSAEGTGNWTTAGTGTEPVVVGTGVQQSNSGYYPTNNSGLHYNKGINLTDFSFDVKIDKMISAGDDVDSWMGPCLLNKNVYFDAGDPTKGAGLVTLIRANADGSASMELNNLLPGEAFASRRVILPLASFKENTVYHFEYKLTASGLEFYLDGTKLATMDWLKNVFTDNIGYFTFSASDNQKKESKWTILKMNDQDAATFDPAGGSTTTTVAATTTTTTAATEETTTTTESSAQTTDTTAATTASQETTRPNVNTGDSQTPIAFAAVLTVIASAATLMAVANKKKLKNQK